VKFTVVVLRRAKVDAQGIYDWIAERSEQGAAQWARVYGEALLALRGNPDQHAISPESDALGISIRQSLFKTRRGRTYRLLYQIIGGEVRVLRVRGPGQAPITQDDVI
jgi:hypothetical protein